MIATFTRPHNTNSELQVADCDTRNDRRAFLSTNDFESFVREYADRLLAVAKRFLQSEEDAADAVQDALLLAFQARASFHGDSTVYTWLYRIVVNTCLMKLRSWPRAKSVSLHDVLPAFDELGCNNQPVSSEGERGDRFLERQETRATVRACIDQLPHDYRTILVLRDLEEMGTDETATMLNLSRSAVKTRLHRARRALRTMLEPTMKSVS